MNKKSLTKLSRYSCRTTCQTACSYRNDNTVRSSKTTSQLADKNFVYTRGMADSARPLSVNKAKQKAITRNKSKISNKKIKIRNIQVLK